MSNEYENAQENNNQETGQIEAQGVGQDGMVEQQESSQDSKDQQIKYFQSEKDKLYAENQKLKQYEKVGWLSAQTTKYGRFGDQPVLAANTTAVRAPSPIR